MMQSQHEVSFAFATLLSSRTIRRSYVDASSDPYFQREAGAIADPFFVFHNQFAESDESAISIHTSIVEA
jgi:hypothetical protein